MFIHINREEVTQLSSDNNGVNTINECMFHHTWRHQTKLEKQ